MIGPDKNPHLINENNEDEEDCWTAEVEGDEVGGRKGQQEDVGEVDHVGGQADGPELVVAEPEHLETGQRGGELWREIVELIGAEVELQQAGQILGEIGREPR